MPKPQKNLPVDTKWHDTTALGAKAKNHRFVDGEYIETEYVPQEFPKFKYHADYLHDRKEGVDYAFTQVPQLVNTPEEEMALGDEWKNSPGEFGIITSPDAETQQKRKRALAAQGANWRNALPNSNPEVTEMHLRFLQFNGAEVKTMADVFTFLAGMTSQQMTSFMKEAKEWDKNQSTPMAAKSPRGKLVTATA